MPNREPLLQCRELGFTYAKGEAPVFSRVSLAVGAGEAVLLMGPSGCGKSSLAYCLAGLYPEYAGTLEGSILVDGQELAALSPGPRSRQVSILFQNPDNQFCMGRVDHEILFALENINYPGDMEARMKELLALVGLEEVAASPIHTLSGGTKQKIALATALATGARLLILDEPFANIDPAACAELALRLRGLKEAGLGLLVVDHRLDYWRPFLTQVLLMNRDGTLDPHAIGPGELEAQRESFTCRGLFFGDEWLAGRRPVPMPTPAKNAVEARDLSIFYDKRPVLSGLTFSVPRGTITALVGKNGSGKSTLLSAMAGVGRCRGALTTSCKAGLVFQNPRYQFLSLKVREEVTTTLAVVDPSATAQALQSRADSLLEEFGLLAWAEASPYELSQGQQRRLAILSMLAGDRPLLLLDEPTYAQDEQATRFIMDLLERRVQGGLTAVIATHDLALAEAFASQVLLLEDGVLTQLDATQFTQYAMARRAT